MDSGTLLSGALALFTLASTTTAGLYIGLNKRAGQRAASAEASEDALRKRHEDQLRLTQECQVQIDHLKGQVETLSQLATGEVHWTALEDQLDAHHLQATEHWEKASDLLGQIRDQLRKS